VHVILAAALAIGVWLVPAVVAAADAFQLDLVARRIRLMDGLGDQSIFVLFSAPVQVYSHDIDYEYRQDSDLYYLTGIPQPDTVLVLMPGNESRRELLFISPPDPDREHRDGHRLTPAEAESISGIRSVYFSTEFEPFVEAAFAGRSYDSARHGPTSQFGPFFRALADGRAELSLVLDVPATLDGPIDETRAFGNRVVSRFDGISVRDAGPSLARLRRVKSAFERDQLTRSVAISVDAHLAGMRVARPGAYEYEVEAAIEHVFLSRGALGGSYPSIVGSGPNATILHYQKSRRRMAAGELLLVDAAASHEYMTGDITRTYPVSGTFSLDQRALYEIVLAAQDAAIAAIVPGVTPNELCEKTVQVVAAGLFRLGLITDATGDEYRQWYTHGCFHYVGLDVHDVGSTDEPLEPGVAFVIEPGIYIRPEALDHLPNTAGYERFAARVRPAVERYAGIGIRIEDSFLLTETSVERLSAGVPRTIDEIEHFLAAAASGAR